MKLFGYIFKFSNKAKWNWKHFKLHKRGKIRHLVWGKFSILFGPIQYCSECEIETGLETICQECQEYYFCECGQRLEDSYGSPGDGFCCIYR